jgi:hypothetical protein
LFVYNTIGFLAIHPFISLYLKHLGLEQAEFSKDNGLVELIVLRKNDILLKKINYVRIDSKEFRLNGNLYDIVKEIEKDSSIFLYCINDNRENSLFNELCKKIDDNVANRKQRNNNHNIIKKSITEPVSYLTINETDNAHLTYNNHSEKKYSFVWKEVITPPPQTLISII